MGASGHAVHGAGEKIMQWVQLCATLRNSVQLCASLCKSVPVRATLCNSVQVRATLRNFVQVLFFPPARGYPTVGLTHPFLIPEVGAKCLFALRLGGVQILHIIRSPFGAKKRCVHD